MAPLFAGKYEIIQKLAQGGMAQVYLAKQKGLDGFEKVVVIKRILPHLAEGKDFVRMFLDEARTAADLRHANIVNIYEVGEADQTYFMAMEFLHGRDIRKIQRAAEKRREKIPTPVVMEIIRQAALGLHYAHEKTDLQGQSLKIVHRDISPHNLIVTFEGTCKVVDFGIAKAESQTQQTASGVLKGKYSYMSPEQAGGKSLTAHSDQYALGIVAWEMLTMKRLFRRENEIMTLHAIIANEVPEFSDLMVEVPEGLEAIIMRMLAPNADDRFASCQEAALAIEDFLVSERMPHSAVRVSQYLMNLFEEELNAEEETGRIVLGNTSASGAEDSLTDFDAPTQAYSQSGTQAKAEFADSSAVPSNTDFHEAVTSMEAPRSRIDASDATQRDVFSSSERLVQEPDGTQVTQSQGAAGPFLPAAAPVQGAGAKRAGIAAAALLLVGGLAFGVSQTSKPEAMPAPKAEPPTTTPPKSAQQPQPYFLKVESVPPKASIRFNGKDYGTAPVTIPVPRSELPFEVEAYLPKLGLQKSICFLNLSAKDRTAPCTVQFTPASEEIAPPSPRPTSPAASPAPAVKVKPPSTAPETPKNISRPKLKLID